MRITCENSALGASIANKQAVKYMLRKSTCVAGVLAVGLLMGTGVSNAFAQQPATDNTKVNQRDRKKTEPTADQAKENPNDREIMQKIRKSVVDDKSLSTYAHNVKIVSQHGKVTLKGPVRSDEEKKTVEQKATEVAGAGNVTNEITVKPETKKKTS
jgi:hyperosmotically inducible periplasmic protein